MKRILTVSALALSFAVGAVLSAQVRDLRDLEGVHTHVVQAIREMEHARAANHYDMDGHGVKAEEHMREAEQELRLALAAAKAAK